MSNDRSWGRVELDVNVARERVIATPGEDTPFRIALLGDFSGRGGRGIVERGRALVNRGAVRVDRDDFDDVLARFSPSLAPRLAGDVSVALRFRELDDFHPDRLYEQLPLFRELRELRRRLANPSTFAAAARELRGTEGEAVRDSALPPPPPSARSGSLLEDIVGGPLPDVPLAREAGGGADADEGDLRAVIRRIVAPHLIPTTDPRQPEMVAQVDAAIAERMRLLLHHPDVQALEALWRALFLLVRRLDTDGGLQLHLIDLSRDELVADLAGDGPIEETALYRLVVDASVGTPGAAPWALLAGAYRFGAGGDDAALLARLGAIAAGAGAPFLGEGAPALAGCTSFAEQPQVEDWTLPPAPAFERLRASAVAPWIGLVAPRVLMRAPYGAAAEAIDSFPFEEVATPPAHESLLWGNPAMACVLLLGESFTSAGWSLRPGMTRDIGGLPYHLVRADGAPSPVPCAEIVLTERGAERLMERGVMALASIKGADAVRLVRFQSIANPLAALAGRWSGARA
ncbi:MAG TPA: type VI secretion system contractile sheath large subunit [Gemmatimonadaceae bacterium]